MYGNEVARLIDDEKRSVGKYVIPFDSDNHRPVPGVYFYTLSGEGIYLKRKMMLVR